MGQEILYCSKCQTQLRSADFEKGTAVHLEGQAHCKKCARDAVKSLPAEKQAQLLMQANSSREAEPPLKGGESPGSTTDRILKVMTGRPFTRRFISRDSGSGPVLGVLAGVVAVAVGIVILTEMLGGGYPPPVPEKASRPGRAVQADPFQASSDGIKVRLDPPRDPAIPALPLENREQIAKESLQKARDYASARPSDFAGQHSRFEEAAWEARETSLQESARAELKAVENRERESYSAELTALEATTRQAQEREEYGKAMTMLEEAKRRHPGAAWAGELERKVAQVNEAMARQYALVREKALEARVRGSQAEVNVFRERVKKWDMPAWATDLDHSLADAAKPPESPKPLPPETPPELPPRSLPKPPAGRMKPGLLPVPEAARQREAEAVLKKTFNPDQAKTPREKAELSRTLLSAAASSGAKEADLYVLLRQARNLAALGGEVKTALEATNALAAAFEVDVAAERMELFGKATVKGPDAVAWAGAALDLSTEASDSEDYDTAVKLAGRAESLARAANDRGLQSLAKDSEKEFTELKRLADGEKAQIKTLEAHPEDAGANSAVGKYTCLIKADWKRGPALMAKGSDPALKSLAELELGDPTDAAAQAALGEAWLAQSEKESSIYKARARARGADWLRRATPGLTGMAKISAERKLASLGPPDAARGRQVLDLGDGVKMEFIPIKPGAFVMGGTTAPDEWHVDERPMHRVVLTKGFAMGKYLVTRGQWAAFVKATGYKTDCERNGKAWGSTAGGKWEEVPGNTWLTPARFTQTDDHPAVCISWNDATAFCDWATKVSGRTVTLPTEAEWEYVYHAGTKTRWWFGDQEVAYPDTEWCSSNSGMQTHPVGQKKPNPWGIYDMNGNVHVWCQDFVGPYSGDAVDPTGPTSGEKRIFRGGCWKWGPGAPSSRSYATPSNTGSDYGFRVCLR